jgi:beta-galactosidase
VEYEAVLQAWHGALWEAGLTSDFAHPEHDLSGYRVVVVPQLYLLTDAAVDNLVGHVREGGTLVSGFLTGTADGDDRIRPGGMDERLRDLFGIATVHEWWPLEPGETVPCASVAGDGTGAFHGTVWSEELEVSTAETVGVYNGGELTGLPAVLRQGSAWYVSTLPDPTTLRDLLARVADDAGVRPVLPDRPAGLEAVRRGDLLFLLNHAPGPVTVTVPGHHRDLLTGDTACGPLRLDRHGVAVLKASQP